VARRRSPTLVIPALAAILLSILTAASKEPPPIYSRDHPFVTDSDILKFGPHRRVRLYGIDAPELPQTCDDSAWPARRIAREALVSIIWGRPVTWTGITVRDVQCRGAWGVPTRQRRC
jgi:endonuclease YncB( thermonuclease family)